MGFGSFGYLCIEPDPGEGGNAIRHRRQAGGREGESLREASPTDRLVWRFFAAYQEVAMEGG